jgi:hypothetical protein
MNQPSFIVLIQFLLGLIRRLLIITASVVWIADLNCIWDLGELYDCGDFEMLIRLGNSL